jgi:hypothetical protein
MLRNSYTQTVAYKNNAETFNQAIMKETYQ